MNSMTEKVLDDNQKQKLISEFARLQSIRQRALKILLDIDKKVGEYKLKKFKEKLK